MAEIKPNHSLVVLTRAIERLTPLSLAASWDNVGVLAQAPYPAQANGVLCCIDLTTEVANEALASPNTISMIVCYHPIIFSGLKRLTLDDPLQASVLRCIARGISIVSIHTAADNAWYGVNDYLACGVIGEDMRTGSVVRKDDTLRHPSGAVIRAIKQERNPPLGLEGCGTGRLVSLQDTVSLETLVTSIKRTLGLQFLQLARAPNGKDRISTVAICAGSGSGVLKDVAADVYLTGELGHHEILAANARGIHVIVCNHSATERPWLQSFRGRLEEQMNLENSAVTDEELGPFTVSISTADREPLVVV